MSVLPVVTESVTPLACQGMLAHPNDVYLALTPTGLIRRVHSHQPITLGGENASHLIGQALIGLVHADDRSSLAAMLRVLPQQPGVAFVLPLRWQTGFDRWETSEVVAKYLPDDPWASGIAMVVRCRSEQLANRPVTDTFYRTLVEQSPDLVAILDREGKIRYVNPAVEQLLGYRAEELLGKRPSTN